MERVKKYEIVAKRLENLISSGTLQAGQRIPSIRSTAHQTGFSLMTVLEAYRHLEDQGFIESRPQSGFFVRPVHYHLSSTGVPLPNAELEPINTGPEEVRIPQIIEKLISDAYHPDLVPLGAGIPDQYYLPSEQLSIRMARVIRSDSAGLNRYCFTPGHEYLRHELARRMIEAGCGICPDDILVTDGATHALSLCLQAVTRPGDAVAIESPGYYGFYALLQHLHLKVAEIPCDPQTGISLNVLEDVLERFGNIKCLLLSPNYSNPTGAVLPDENKQDLIGLCAKHNVLIIEDDTYGELTFDARRPRALKSYDTDRVLFVGSVSKTLAPGYRIGWIAAGPYHKNILQTCRTTFLASPLPTQMAVASFLKDGGMAHHLRRIRKHYRQNIKLFSKQIAASFPPGTRISRPRGGYFIWLECPDTVDSMKLAEQSLLQGISIAPGVLFSSAHNYRRFIRLNCAVPWSPRIEQAIEILGSLAKFAQEQA